MKKSMGVFLVLVIFVLFAILGVGYVYFAKYCADSKTEIQELKNEIVALNKNTESLKNNKTIEDVVEEEIAKEKDNENKVTENKVEESKADNTKKEEKVVDNNELNIEKIKKASDIKGYYEGKVTGSENWGDTVSLALYKDGSFIYNTVAGIDVCTAGYYTIEDNKIILHQIVTHGNDVSLTIFDSVTNVVLELNEDGSIKDNNLNTVFKLSNNATETNFEKTDIAASMKSALKNNYLY